ncbi:sodium Bile acid symporter family protein [Leptospira yanagawae serovar Saopaulo str. Sao Paulo = ATCC 700523]|uniref:Sodium Bile acid symporter family protein n=1 Tax=Leptospira yanagawae serovar Saopaulo str. Sao Paulo = ATCC 700523 TaxID=1249483 RepID=A0A5E8HBF1_9LEPT|nr:bile acid:sodium symporter family protein [Leptospira yanagawae]EOQ88534.1 sodium Bile acid symporter family protein [Leptospira yanagawae serovar Saopaulo str. Sao Paulo = ATCC 700523]
MDINGVRLNFNKESVYLINALGMVLVASCPGGKMSNFFTHLAKGNLALSVSLTTFSSTFAFLLTPIGFFFWGNILPITRSYLKSISVSPIEILVSITILLVVPLLLGIFFQIRFSKLTHSVKRVVQRISILLLAFFIIGALVTNWKFFKEYIHLLFGLVFLMNLAGLSIGYYIAKLFQLPMSDRKTISIETGIQNSSLGLAIVFSFFDGLGGMAMICAWWGIWHLLAGAAIATYWNQTSKLGS